MVVRTRTAGMSLIRDSTSASCSVTQREGAAEASKCRKMRGGMRSRSLLEGNIRRPMRQLPGSISRVSMSLGCSRRALSFSREARQISRNRSNSKGAGIKCSNLTRPFLMRQLTCSLLIFNSKTSLRKRRSLGLRRLIHQSKRPLLLCPRRLRSWVISRSILSMKK